MSKPEKEKVVEAGRFVLRDAAGQVRAELGVNDRNVVALKLCDDRGSCRAEVLVTKDGTAGLQFYDALGRPRLVLYLDQLEELSACPSIALIGRDGQVVVELPAKPVEAPAPPVDPDRPPPAED
jgi:hypothetical protein